MVARDDRRSMPREFGFRHEEEHGYQIQSDKHGDNVKSPVDTERLNDKSREHRTKLVATEDGKAINGDLLASVVQEKDVGNGARHDRFNRGLEDTKEGATEDEDCVVLL
jgi:hypothetical protein